MKKPRSDPGLSVSRATRLRDRADGSAICTPPSVPLTPQLLALLGERKADNVPLFEVSSANAMLNTLKALDGNGFTVHGFCSSFEDWGAEATSLPRDLVKLCTARHPEQDR